MVRMGTRLNRGSPHGYAKIGPVRPRPPGVSRFADGNITPERNPLCRPRKVTVAYHHVHLAKSRPPERSHAWSAHAELASLEQTVIARTAAPFRDFESMRIRTIPIHGRGRSLPCRRIGNIWGAACADGLARNAACLCPDGHVFAGQRLAKIMVCVTAYLESVSGNVIVLGILWS